MTRKRESSSRQLRNHADMVWRRSCADAAWYAGAQGKPEFLQCNKGQSFANQVIVPRHPEWDAFINHCLRYDPAQRPYAPEAFAMVHAGPGTCAVIEESQALTSLACALPPSGT